MHYYIYKKEINIAIFIIIIILLIIGGIYYMRGSNPIKNLNVTQNGNNITFDDNKVQKNKYDYYQVYLFPSSYNLSCESQLEGFCNKLEKNKDLFKTYILGFFGRDTTKGDIGEIEIKTYLGDKENDKTILLDLIKNLYIEPIKNIDNSGYEKYFDYKKQEGQKINLNELEINCVNQIKESIPDGSFDEENIIKEKVKSNCEFYSNINPLQMTFGTINFTDKNKLAKIKLDINELNINYKFFKKLDGQFIEEKKENKTLKTNFSLNDVIDLSQIK